MSFPYEQEKKLRKVFQLASNYILEDLKGLEIDEEIIQALNSYNFTKGQQEKIMKLLGEVAVGVNSSLFNSWRTLTPEELKKTDLTGAKKWIKINYDLAMNINRTMGEYYSNYKKNMYNEILQAIEKPLKFRLDKLYEGKISKSDMNKLVGELNQFRTNKEMKALIDSLKKRAKVSKSDFVELERYALRKNELRARNETGNLYASELEALMAENDMEYFVWRTMEDTRVREEHKTRNRKIFSLYGSELPGQDFGCRCWAEPIQRRE